MSLLKSVRSFCVLLALAALAVAEDGEFKSFRPTEEMNQEAIPQKTILTTRKGNFTQQEFYSLPLLSRLTVYNWTNELVFTGVILAFVASHFIGNHFNKKAAQKWIKSHVEVLRNQFYQVGFKDNSAVEDPRAIPLSEYLKCKGPIEYVTYASGRLNIALLHGRMTLMTRHNFIMLVIDMVMSFFLNYDQPHDKIEYFIIPTDSDKSSYDNFVFAIVSKEVMKRVREENYDLSLTRTVDHPKLPFSLTVMSEAAEITDNLLTTEMIEALKKAPQLLEYFVISDLPTEKPKTAEEYKSSKRALIALKAASTPEEEAASKDILNAALNTIDVAVAKAYWRPEVSRKIKATRDDEIRKLKRQAEEEKAEEVAKQRAKEKKEQKQSMSKLSAEEQKKFQQKEREKELRRMQKKQTKRG
ncbi:hypothetical protein V1511DRAFT_156372 [Dipodascopsis uninucleata]